MTKDQIIEEYLDELGSKSPVPGGGGASALAGAFGVSLGMMVASLTIGKKTYKDVEPEVQDCSAHLSTLREVFLRLADKDEEVFLPLSRAYGMKRSTESEKLLRDQVMEQALFDAAIVPLSIMETALGAFETLKKLAGIGSKLAVSDAGVAASYLQTALIGASMNVRINLKSMKDLSRKAQLQDKCERYLLRGEKLYWETMQTVEERIGS